MTRKEIATLKEMERKAWYNLMLYEYNNAPRTTVFEIVNEWAKTDIEYREYLHTWCALNDILVSLGIDADFNEEAFELHSRYYHECKETEETTEEETETETPTEDEEETEEVTDKWFDIETGETVTERELWHDYESNYTEEERKTYTFGQYKRNCLTVNGGTLERI